METARSIPGIYVCPTPDVIKLPFTMGELEDDMLELSKSRQPAAGRIKVRQVDIDMIVQLRKAGLTQQVIAEQVGLSQKHVSRLLAEVKA